MSDDNLANERFDRLTARIVRLEAKLTTLREALESLAYKARDRTTTRIQLRSMLDAVIAVVMMAIAISLVVASASMLAVALLGGVATLALAAGTRRSSGAGQCGCAELGLVAPEK